MKRVYRPTEGRVIGGVCAGLGRYFEVDPVLFRLGFLLLALCGAAGIVAYIIAMFVIPSEADVFRN